MRYLLFKIINIVYGVINRLFYNKLVGNNNLICDKNIMPNLRINIKGTNNNILLKNITVNKHTVIRIFVCGDNNNIELTNVYIGESLLILLGQEHPYFGAIRNSCFLVKENTSIEELKYICYNSNAECIINKNCMISSEVMLYNTDAHPVIDLCTDQVVNKVRSLIVGEHCWLGQRVTVLKNSFIPNDCILGYGAVYSGEETSEHVVYAGNPAKCVKNNVTWNPNGNVYGYIANE